jgi:hypothetical protein
MATFKPLDADTVATGITFDFGAPDETAEVFRNVFIESEQQNAIRSLQINSTLINFGSVISGENIAVFLDAGDGTLTNASGAFISGMFGGVLLFGSGAQIVNNAGTVIGGQSFGLEIGPNASGATIVNRGSFAGQSDGIAIVSQHAGGSVRNYGLIKGDTVGVSVDTASGLQTVIINAPRGIISGGVEATVGNLSINNAGKLIDGNVDGLESVILHNRGLIQGNIVAGSNSVIANPGHIQGTVTFFLGHGVFNGAGGTSGAIFAGNGDRIIAGRGKVDIHLLASNDILTAGPGSDRFFFEHAPNGQVDRINHFSPAHDRIVLSEADFPGLGPAGAPLQAQFFIPNPAATATPEILYDRTDGFLFYDPGGKGDPIHFATLTNHPLLSHTAFILEA